LIAGPGEGLEVMQSVSPNLRNRIEFLGRLTDEEKASFFKSVSVYVAPNTGGESFGIILAEAMASGTPIVASNLPAFVQVLNDGKNGAIFENGDSKDLSKAVIALAHDVEMRKKLSLNAGSGAARFDWETVGPEIMNVYLHAIGSGEKVSVGSEQRGWLKFLSREEG
jgi:phosphatidylinositol alpha-mannosyltransferase